MTENMVKSSHKKTDNKIMKFEITDEYPDKVSDETRSDIETRLFNVFKKYVDKK